MKASPVRDGVARQRFLAALRPAGAWREVLDGIRAALAGVPIGFELPAAEQIAERMEVSPPTVYRAIRELAAYNLLGLSRGRRARVLSHTRSRVDGHLRGDRRVMRVRSAGYRFVGPEDPLAGQARAALRLDQSQAIVVFDRVRLFASDPGDPSAGAPVRWDRAYMPARLVTAEVLAANYGDPGTSLKTLQRDELALVPAVRDFIVVPGLATPAEKRRLGLGPGGRPIATVTQTSAARRGDSLVFYEFLVTVLAGWKLAYRWVREEADG
jgi:DNA-binding GntR family transcriptional regulator